MRRNYLFWGIILVVFSAIILLRSFKVLPGDSLSYLWQVFLIILGCWIIVNSLWKPNHQDTENTSISLKGAVKANIRINHAAGKLNITSGAMGGELLSCASSDTLQQKTRLNGDTLDVRISPVPNVVPFIGFAEGFNWNIKINKEIPISLIIETGASQTIADLTELNITVLKLSTGASSTSILLPSKPERSFVNINAGVATLDLTIPTNVAAQIRIKDGLSALNINKARFFLTNRNHFETQEYSLSNTRTEITIEAGISSISIH